MKYYQINYDIVIVLIDRLEISDISLPNLYLHSKETSTSPFSNSHWDSPTTWDLPESRDKFSWKTDEILQFQFANTKSFFFSDMQNNYVTSKQWRTSSISYFWVLLLF